MTIQDLAGNPFDTASSPMIGFLQPSATAQARALSLRIYRFLIEGIREADQVDGDRFVERFLEGPQGVWNGIDASIRSLPDMWSITKCADRFLPYLKWIVGWTSELDFITNDLDAATLRRLISTSVPFWKVRGTEDVLAEILQLTTAARTRVLDWFDLRYIADETSVGEVHLGYDSWMLELPGPPDYPEKQMNVRIVDDGALNRRLVRNLCKLTRPGGERITVTYLGFLDLFTVDDDASQWTQSAGGASPVVEGGAMKITPTDSVYANPSAASSWRNYCVSATFKGASFVMSVYRATDQDCYLVVYDTGQIVIYRLVGGVPALLGGAITYAPDYPDSVPSFFTPDMWFPFSSLSNLAANSELIHTIRVQVTEENGDTRISVWLNGNFMISVLDSSSLTQGTFGFPGIFGAEMEVREVEMFFLPLQQDFIDIQGASEVIEEPA